ncbi:hypothetical protein QGN29_09180 [Temperatibacter marinus]|uniref:Uncharacterized protein n=1 Tax=Temperatibacter marinus TaxID=1456591 RepID=A0AA52EBE7_9PROT|nr:hypothetical protein [Temperatibacter marinus]WND01726.1 hypothetical protein QGN29_09180 [Temperatibacter marinus]
MGWNTPLTTDSDSMDSKESRTVSKQLDARIHELVRYARDNDVNDRSTLFRNLIDMFITGKAPKSDPTRSQLIDVIKALIPHTEEETRQTSADLLATVTEPPMDIVMALINDKASIVSSLLCKATLTEDQLIEIIENTGRSHHQLLATRNDLSANVWISLARAAPVIEPNFDTQALWDDHLFVKRESATVTALRPSQTASMDLKDLSEQQKSLREEKDFIGMDVFETPDIPASSPVHNSDKTSIENHGAWKTPPVLSEENPPLFDDSDIQAFLDDPVDLKTPDAASSLSRPESPEPVDGMVQWQWGCNKRLVIEDIVGLTPEIHKALPFKEGSSLIDLLGLDEKPNHPIVKAINRRGTIHDAPLYLKSFPKGHRYWTMEATPSFSMDTGNFKGYVGKLTGVLPCSDDDNFELPEQLPETKIHIPDRLENTPLTASVNIIEDDIDRAFENSKSLSSLSESQTSDFNRLLSAGAEKEIARLQDSIEQTVSKYMSSIELPVEDSDPSPQHQDDDKAELPLSRESAITEEENVSASMASPLSQQSQLDYSAASLALEQLEKAISAIHALDHEDQTDLATVKSHIRLHSNIAAACFQSLKDLLR